MARVFVVDLEAVETRYTGEWKIHFPNLLRKQGHDVQVIEGLADIPHNTTPGAFLNFGGTNVYKASQVEKMGRLFCEGKIKSGDHFIFTDAWHPGLINLKYMSELLNTPVKIHALWHAGSYDPQDFLGRLIGNKPWVRYAEKSFFYAADHNYFATEFHIKLFTHNLLGYTPAVHGETDKIVRSGWPMEYMDDSLLMYKNMPKRDLILFPHRIAPEKQVDIFRDLKEHLPQYEFVVCQDQTLTKNEYHNLLGEAKLIFSANLQETLGISCYEGAVVDAIPMVPDRLSYSEMYFDIFKYPSQWTENFQSYTNHRQELCLTIIEHMEFYQTRIPMLKKQTEFLKDRYFTCDNLLDKLK
jgi:glycosyltransferase involved in cell wall biosynthesis